MYIAALVLLGCVTAVLHFFNIRLYENVLHLAAVYVSLVAGLFFTKKILKLV